MALLVAALGATGCGEPSAAYCREVAARQAHLSEALGTSGERGLLAALPDFRKLQEKAPGDIADDWAVLNDALGALERAVEAGDESGTATAATALAGPGPTRAIAAIEQQVRDVCHTPLTL